MVESKIGDLLIGAVDMHVHAYPEFDSDHPLRFSNLQHMRICRDAGMRGVVIKSHMWPTTTTANLINEALEADDAENKDFTTFGSFTFNTVTGGLDLFSLEVALQNSAKVVWLPTTTSRNDASRGNVRADILPVLSKFQMEKAIYLLDDNGQLRPEVKDIVAMCKDYDVALHTGHISQPERHAVAKEAYAQGFKKMVFSHPDSASTKGTYEEILEMAALGCYVELVVNGMMPNYQRVSTAHFANIIQAVGADKVVIDTDYFPSFDYLPCIPDMLRMLYGCLLTKGVSFEQMETITRESPAALLNM